MIAVIGAAYGDEGKGLVTDALCAEHFGAAINVRASSSAQAGHTVVTPERGLRHAFGHVGAGTFAGARTWLGPEFYVHPIFFAREAETILSKWGGLAVSASPHCPVVTPFDMDLNRRAEQARGAMRHGSCGAGLHEAVLRHVARPLTFGDVATMTYGQLRGVLRGMRDYATGRAATLRLPDEPISDAVIERYLADVEIARRHIGLDAAPRFGFHEVVFEGAQGLRLDQDSPDFPHVTHARTGLAPVVDLVPPGTVIDAYYVTRCYTTRHGAGPLPGEWKGDEPLGLTADDANPPNEWQGGMRFGPLDLDRLAADIVRDADAARPFVVVHIHVVMTCCDQIELAMLLDGRAVPPVEAALELAERVDAVNLLVSRGRTRDHLVPVRATEGVRR